MRSVGMTKIPSFFVFTASIARSVSSPLITFPQQQVLHCRQAVLSLLSEPSWLHAAAAATPPGFELSSLDGLLEPFVKLVKLACVAEPADVELDAISSESLNLVWVRATARARLAGTRRRARPSTRPPHPTPRRRR